MVFLKVLPKIAKKTNLPKWLVKQGTQTCVNKSIFSQRVKPNGDVFIKNTPKVLIQEPKGATERFYEKNKDLIEKLLTDKDGNIVYRDFDGNKLIKFKFDDEFKPLKEELGALVHRTDPQSYIKIMKDNFKINNKKFAESFHGIYFIRKADDINPELLDKMYGKNRIECLLNGKTAIGDVDRIASFIGYPSALDDYLKNNNIIGIGSNRLKELFLKDEFLKRGYKAFYSKEETFFAKCRALVVFDPKDLIYLNK
ncbi:hypothetical protein J6R97_01685 [bacterium]|nr:hypothetical protein [bacterium]